MKKLLLLFLFPFTLSAQQIDKVYKGADGIWRGDISGPITNYPKQGVVIVDTTAIPDPIPPTPQPLPTVNVDNVNPHFVYTGTWVNGPTTAPGFYPAPPNSTMAYSNISGNTATLLFTGTTLEAYLEQLSGVGHGSAVLKVDNLPDTTINLGAAGQAGSKLVFKRKLPAGNHTFKLTVSGSGYVVFDYVKINGVTVAPPTIPVPPIPPTTGDIIVMPGQSIKQAVESAASGKVVKISDGTYNETTVNVPVGVSITGTKGKVSINPVGSYQFMSDNSVFQLKSGSMVDGNQYISGITILGADKTNGGIVVENRRNVKIYDVRIEKTTFYGIWLKNAVNPEVATSEFYNGSYASSGWCTGQIMILNLTGMNIHHNTFSSDNSNEGYGISVYGNPSGTALPMSGRIHYNDVRMHPSSVWSGGKSPNIGIEFHDVRMAGVEIDHNTIRNVLSIDPNYPTYSGRTNVHDNTFTMGGASFTIELCTSNITIANNIFRETSIMTADFEATGKHTDIIIDGNDFVSNNANPNWGGTFLIGSDGIQMIYRNNKITKGNYPLFFYDDGSSPSKSQLTDGGGNVIK